MNSEIERLLEEFRLYKSGSRNTKDSSLNKYIAHLKEFFNFINIDPIDIKLDHILQYKKYIITVRKNQINTQRGKQCAIQLFFSWFSACYHSENPANLLKPIQEIIKIPAMPTPDELKRMVDSCDESTNIGRRDAAIMCLLAATGIRLGECVNLNVGNIEKNENNFTCIVPSIKSRRERYIPFGDFVIHDDMVSDYFNAYFRDITLLLNYKYSDPLFKQNGFKYSGMRLGRDGLTKLVRKHRIKCGIEKIITPKSFRHYFGTYSYVNGKRLSRIKYLMGHAWLETTQRYEHLGDVVSGKESKTASTAGLKSKKTMAGWAKI